ncbi:MAG: DUF4105 domain-containing protein [Bdellovibrionales bacterium]|nr:DUF4105 domain-containing protein [Bdellovibrionales bacterium]
MPLSHADSKKLWWRLLHFDERNQKSDVMDPNFFLHPDGASDPQKELQTEINYIKNEPEGLEEEKRFSCRFPARLRFLTQNFSVHTKNDCSSFKQWSQRAEPESISYIYATQFVGNPASAFGHSFLRLDRAYRQGLLGYSLTYSAQVQQGEGGLIYALKGLLGGYLGEYQWDRYYPKIHGYANRENRDLWEYELQFNREERQRIFAHAWELSRAGRTTYKFLNRNCSYQLLKLLEVANEKVELSRPADGFFVTPQETLKILAQNQLIKKSNFKPSLRRKVATQFDDLDSGQKQQLRQVLLGRHLIEKVVDPQVASALVATLAMNEIKQGSADSRALFARATAMRSHLPVVRNSLPLREGDDLKMNPLYAHHSMQLRAGGGYQDSVPFMQLGFRPALHAINDVDTGFLPHTQLLFLDSDFRIENHGIQNKIKLHEMNLIEIKSLQSFSDLDKQKSWAAQLAFKPLWIGDCVNCHGWRGSMEMGYSSDILDRTLGYVLMGGALDGISSREGRTLDLRLGPSAVLGMVIRPGSNYVFQIQERLETLFSRSYGAESFSTLDLLATKHINTNYSLVLNALWTQKISKEKEGLMFEMHFAHHF